MSILPHSFDGLNVSQASEDFFIGQYRIPKGYVNLTEMCKAGKKKLADFLRLKRTKAYTSCLSTDTGFPISALIVEIRGGGKAFSADQQSTWGHHLIALSLAVWISPEFELKANKVLWGVINGDFSAITEEAEKDKLEFLKEWCKIRASGKKTRRSLTDSIKAWWYLNDINEPYSEMGRLISIVTNQIYQRLWGRDAMQLESILGCPRNKIRDYCSIDDLALIDRAEANVTDLIDDDNLHPLQAVKVAHIKKAKQMIRPK
jgi:hypothetical protein